MKKIPLRTAVVVFLAISLGFLGCQSGQKEDKVLKIGAILPLTGYVSFLGEQEKDILTFAADRYNRAKTGRHVVEIVFGDSKGLAKEGVTLINKNKLEGIKYTIVSLTRVAQAVQPVCDRDKIINFVLSIHPYIAKKSQYSFRPYFGLEGEVDHWMKIIRHRKAKRIAALYVRDASIDVAMKEILKKRVENLGGELVALETYDFSERDVDSLLSKIAAAKPDIIVTEDFGNIYPLILKKSIKYGLKDKLLAGIGVYYVNNLEQDLFDNLIFVGPTFTLNPNNKYASFVKEFKEKYKYEPSFDAIYTYFAFKVIIDAIERYGIDTAKAADGINGNSFEILGDSVSFDNSGTANSALSLGIIKNGKKVLLPALE